MVMKLKINPLNQKYVYKSLTCSVLTQEKKEYTQIIKIVTWGKI